ncbi:MAG: hypothetical protein GY778_30370 [bacterium]|nr:hypothetical protein [bacterium]
MADEEQNQPDKTPSDAAAKPPRKRKYNWEDPNVPAGDGPPMPRWPVWVAAAAWGGWLLFVIVMMVLKQRG